MKSYIETLLSSLIESFFKDSSIALSKDIQSVNLHIDVAIPIGLIINELVTNALKYGLTSIQPMLYVALKQVDENQLLLIVSDNGNHSFQYNNKAFGLKLVDTLLKQLNAKLEKKHGDRN
jgi:two-component sensor histidine kinase